MEDKKLQTLYKLLQRAIEESDADAIAALRWAIFNLEK